MTCSKIVFNTRNCSHRCFQSMLWTVNSEAGNRSSSWQDKESSLLSEREGERGSMSGQYHFTAAACEQVFMQTANKQACDGNLSQGLLIPVLLYTSHGHRCYLFHHLQCKQTWLVKWASWWMSLLRWWMGPPAPLHDYAQLSPSDTKEKSSMLRNASDFGRGPWRWLLTTRSNYLTFVIFWFWTKNTSHFNSSSLFEVTQSKVTGYTGYPSTGVM